VTAVRTPQVGPPDPDSFEHFYVATVKRTLAAAHRVAGDHDVAQDATQDAYVVMVGCWCDRRRRTLQENQRYVVGIAIKKVADWYRRNGRLLALDDESDRPVEDDGYEHILDQLTVFKAVRHLVEGQPIGMRAVGLLYFFEEFEYGEIADLLGISSSTVRTQVQRLRARLRPLVNRIAELDGGGEQS
jgi:RNA polymerase sigma factor (sigma-70 family)